MVRRAARAEPTAIRENANAILFDTMRGGPGRSPCDSDWLRVCCWRGPLAAGTDRSGARRPATDAARAARPRAGPGSSPRSSGPPRGGTSAAAAAYWLALAAGAPSPAVYPPGRRADGRGRAGRPRRRAYRDAIAAGVGRLRPRRRSGGRPTCDDPHGRAQETWRWPIWAGVALDRDGQTRAARQMIRGRWRRPDHLRAGGGDAARLRRAHRSGGRGLLLPGAGPARRRPADDAEAAFHEFLERAARRPLGRRPPRPTSRSWNRRPRGRPAPRRDAAALACWPAGTVLATGGSPAPLIDAAWREQAAILDDCLDGAGGLARSGAPLRVAIEIELDARGRVTAAVAKLAAPNADLFARCLEGAVRSGLRLPAAPGGRPTRARTELLVGFARRPLGPGGSEPPR